VTAPLTLTQRATIALTALKVISIGKPRITQGLDLIERERNQLLAVANACHRFREKFESGEPGASTSMHIMFDALDDLAKE
jgi:hypothetical protein